MTNGNNGNNGNNTAMESLSLCNCCCSARTKKDSTIVVEKDTEEKEETKPKYEFGHATHYTYGVTSPRLLCEFETGTPPSP